MKPANGRFSRSFQPGLRRDFSVITAAQIAPFGATITSRSTRRDSDANLTMRTGKLLPPVPH